MRTVRSSLVPGVTAESLINQAAAVPGALTCHMLRPEAYLNSILCNLWLGARRYDTVATYVDGWRVHRPGLCGVRLKVLIPNAAQPHIRNTTYYLCPEINSLYCGRGAISYT